MSWLQRLGARLRREPSNAIRVRVVIKGRVGAAWLDVDRRLALPAGATLAALIERADRTGIGLSRALEDSPHLRHTLMWNGERAPLDDYRDRPLADGDEVYLLGPLAGG